MKMAWLRKMVCTFTLIAFLAMGVVPPSFAQTIVAGSDLPAAGSLVSLSTAFTPAILRGLKVDPLDPFKFDFLVDPGDSKLSAGQLSDESTRLIRYFLASMTTPEDDLWVNLSPYESDRIIPEAFGLTEMGRDLLAEDYMLKQITASLMYPENEPGKSFWQKIYAQAYELYGTTDVPLDTFNKVWITPDIAEVYEDKGVAFIGASRLKVMLESDYLASNLQAANAVQAQPSEQELGTSEMTRNIIRDVMIPILEKEVNEGRNFAQLRQVYNSLILAAWYKKRLKESIFSQVYMDQNKVAGVDLQDKQMGQKIWAQYVESFKKGAYNYIKEEYDTYAQELMPRKYFAGGVLLSFKTDNAMKLMPIADSSQIVSKNKMLGLAVLTVGLVTAGGNVDAQTIESSSRNNMVEMGPAASAKGSEVRTFGLDHYKRFETGVATHIDDMNALVNELQASMGGFKLYFPGSTNFIEKEYSGSGKSYSVDIPFKYDNGDLAGYVRFQFTTQKKLHTKIIDLSGRSIFTPKEVTERLELEKEFNRAFFTPQAWKEKVKLIKSFTNMGGVSFGSGQLDSLELRQVKFGDDVELLGYNGNEVAFKVILMVQKGDNGPKVMCKIVSNNGNGLALTIPDGQVDDITLDVAKSVARVIAVPGMITADILTGSTQEFTKRNIDELKTAKIGSGVQMKGIASESLVTTFELADLPVNIRRYMPTPKLVNSIMDEINSKWTLLPQERDEMRKRVTRYLNSILGGAQDRLNNGESGALPVISMKDNIVKVSNLPAGAAALRVAGQSRQKMFKFQPQEVRKDKDAVIIVDVSGSMKKDANILSRIDVAIGLANKLIDSGYKGNVSIMGVTSKEESFFYYEFIDGEYQVSVNKNENNPEAKQAKDLPIDVALKVLSAIREKIKGPNGKEFLKGSTSLFERLMEEPVMNNPDIVTVAITDGNQDSLVDGNAPYVPIRSYEDYIKRPGKTIFINPTGAIFNSSLKTMIEQGEKGGRDMTIVDAIDFDAEAFTTTSLLGPSSVNIRMPVGEQGEAYTILDRNGDPMFGWDKYGKPRTVIADKEEFIVPEGLPVTEPDIVPDANGNISVDVDGRAETTVIIQPRPVQVPVTIGTNEKGSYGIVFDVSSSIGPFLQAYKTSLISFIMNANVTYLSFFTDGEPSILDFEDGATKEDLIKALQEGADSTGVYVNGAAKKINGGGLTNISKGIGTGWQIAFDKQKVKLAQNNILDLHKIIVVSDLKKTSEKGGIISVIDPNNPDKPVFRSFNEMNIETDLVTPESVAKVTHNDPFSPQMYSDPDMEKPDVYYATAILTNKAEGAAITSGADLPKAFENYVRRLLEVEAKADLETFYYIKQDFGHGDVRWKAGRVAMPEAGRRASFFGELLERNRNRTNLTPEQIEQANALKAVDIQRVREGVALIIPQVHGFSNIDEDDGKNGDLVSSYVDKFIAKYDSLGFMPVENFLEEVKKNEERKVWDLNARNNGGVYSPAPEDVRASAEKYKVDFWEFMDAAPKYKTSVEAEYPYVKVGELNIERLTQQITQIFTDKDKKVNRGAVDYYVNYLTSKQMWKALQEKRVYVTSLIDWVKADAFVDKAQAGRIDNSQSVDKAATGGIDLNTSRMNLNVKGDSSAAVRAMDPALFAQFKNAPGLVPVIIGMSPVGDLSAFLGLPPNSY